MMGLSRLAHHNNHQLLLRKRRRKEPYFFSKIFSGLRSQWMSLALLRRHKAFNSCWAKTLTSVVLKPLN
jgi:hypothetical protein